MVSVVNSGESLELTTDTIAEKFVQYYWRQVVPYARAGEATILQQNSDRQAAIVNLVREAHASYCGSLAAPLAVAEDRGGTIELPVRKPGRWCRRPASARHRLLLPQVPRPDLRSGSRRMGSVRAPAEPDRNRSEERPA